MGAVTANGQAYTDKNGNKVVGYNESASSGYNNNKAASYGTVQKDSIFDPTSKNYNKTVAESNGKISLGGVNNPSDGGSTSGGTGNKTSNAYKRDRRDNISASQQQATALQSALDSANSTPTTQPDMSQYINALQHQTISPAAVTQQPQSTYTPQTYTAPIVPTQAQPTGPTQSELIQQQSDASKLQAAAQLQGVRDQAISDYNTKINGLQGTYQPLRDTQDFQGAKAVNATNEQMANMGITNSGDAITAQVGNRVGNENALGALDRQQLADKTGYETQISDANNAYNSGVASSNAGIDATRLQNLLSQSNADKQFNYQTGRDTVNDANTNWNNQNVVNQQNQNQQNTVWGQNNTTQQQAIDQANNQWNQKNQIDQQNQNQANTVWGQNNTTQQQAIDQANNQWNQKNQIDQQNQNQANTVWGQNNTVNQQNQQQFNTDRGFNADQAQNTFNNGINIAGLTGTYNGQSTLAGQTLTNAQTQKQWENSFNQNQANQQQAQNAFNNGVTTAGLTGTYNGTQTMQGASNAVSVTGQTLQNDYQTLVNANYPQQQALAMAQAKASITGQNLQNDYQTLQNAGWPATQAAQLAQSKAATAGQLLQNAGQSIQNSYMPQQLQGAINAQNANINQSNAAAAASNRSGYGGSGGGSSSGGGSTSDGRVNSGGTTNNGLTSAQYNTEFANASKTMLQAVQSGKGAAWIEANKAGLQALTTTNANGITKNAYNQMLDEYHANNQGTTIQAQDTHNDMINQKAIRNMG